MWSGLAEPLAAFPRLSYLTRAMGFEDPFEDLHHELLHGDVASPLLLRDTTTSSSSSSGSHIKDAAAAGPLVGGKATDANANQLCVVDPRKTEELVNTFIRAPAVDVMEREADFVLNIDVPGVAKQDLKVQISEEGRRGRKRKLLTVSGERKDEDFKEDKEHHVKSSSKRYGRFSRSLVLPDNCNADATQIKARHANGILKLTVPKVKSEPPQKRQAIEIAIA